MKGKVFICLIVAAICVVLIASVAAYRQSIRNKTVNSLGFSFEVLSEYRLKSLNTVTWRVKVYLPKKYYSKENLDRLFRSYSRKYFNNQDMLQVFVYTDKESFKQEQKEEEENPGAIIHVFPDPSQKDSSASFENTRGVYEDASFYREGPGGSVGHRNEWYRFSPDLNNPRNNRTVIMKGVDPNSVREANEIETWETPDNAIKVRVTAYELKNADPLGTYYTFESVNKNFYLLDTREIMTFRHNDKVSIPYSQVRIINNKIAYIFMGWMYAITIDGGHSWSVWDAESDLSNWRCCDYEFIQDVYIMPDGTGIMILRPTTLEKREVEKLYTKDYGQHWNVD